MADQDWIADAVDEVIRCYPYATVYDAIVKHCPFKPDVAYMPVPRCETCAHWERAEYPRPGVHPAGRCLNKVVWHQYDKADIFTFEDFGCVQWKAK